MIKHKRKYGQGKQLRKNFRFAEQTAGMLAMASSTLGISENELTERFVSDVLFDSSKFVICPNCNNYVFYKAMLPKVPVAELACTCGTDIWYDVEAGKIIKTSPNRLINLKNKL